jgi:hypothetical protein
MTAISSCVPSRRSGRAVRLCVTLACVLGVWTAVAGAVAQAQYVHPRLGSFGGGETPRKEFGLLAVTAAVDNSKGPSSGDVYIGATVGPSQPSVVQKFNSDGKYAGVEFDGHETPQGSFGVLDWENFARSGLAVDGSAGPNAGDVYVADVIHNVIDRYSESGKFLCQITGKTPVTTAEKEAECAGSVGSATPAGGFATTTGVAVNPLNGEVYVSDAGHLVIDEFNQAGEYIGQISDSHLTEPGALAFDSTGSIYVDNGALFTGENVIKYDAAGAYVETLEAGHAPNYVAVDTGSGHVYFNRSEAGEVADYSSAGALAGTFAHGEAFSASVIAANASTGDIYVIAGREVVIFGPGIVVPEVSTREAGEVGETTVTLHGEAAPDTTHSGGNVTSCEFEYIEDAAYEKAVGEHAVNPYSGGATAPCAPATPYSGATAVSAKVSALTPDTLYDYRLVASDAGGKGMGEDRTFNTSGPPTVAGELSDSRTSGATVRAEINPRGYKTTCEVQYVDQAAYEASQYKEAKLMPCPEAILPGKTQTARVNLPGLAVSTTYHYRFVAHNGATSGGGLVVGEDQTFATFKIEDFTFEVLNEAGEPYTQAGGHPYELRVRFDFNITSPEYFGEPNVSGNIRTAKVELPPGLIGNPTAVPRCSSAHLRVGTCPRQAEVGEMIIYSAQIDRGMKEFASAAMYNLEAPTGAAAEFGAQFNAFPSVRVDFGVRTGSDYGINSTTIAVNADTGVSGVEVKIKGVPGNFTGANPVVPLLSTPTTCAGPLTAALELDTWQEPSVFLRASHELPAITGCNKVKFEPTLEARPTTDVADAPSGLNVDLHVPQNEDPKGLRSADLRDTTITLPKGITVNPSGANGLEGCTEAQFDVHGTGPAECPDASKVGTVEVDTPLVDHPLPGSFYVATPYQNPFGSLIALYLGIDDPVTGVVVKLAGKVEVNPVTGQLTTTFEENPQLPFGDLKVHLFGGAKAPLRTPAVCGQYETTSSLTPWSAPESGPPATPSDSYAIDQAPGGGPCPHSEAEEPNAPGFEAGTVTPTAGAYSPFVLHLHREDDSQELKGIDTVLPSGVTAKLAGVAECSESAIEAAQHVTGRQEQESPSCPSSSEVGTIDVGAGAGPAPYFVQGRVYLAGPYKGAPFSLAIVTPAVAGPFDLGTVVVRAALYINPETTQVTVKSDPLPTILDGIPLDVKTIVVKVGRPEFTLNPTNCEKMSVGGEALSILGQGSALSDPFQVGSCEALGFAPRFSVSTSGKTSRQDGASLHVTLAYPNAPQGTQANIKSVHVELPKALPSRLATLNHACVESVFAQNPASCPAQSQVGYARAVTPLLPVPLEGPAYFVSHGNQKFPELVVVLQGYGITIDLHGETFIAEKTGITSSTFSAVPDQPITSFELTLPQGPSSALAANGNLCAATKTVLVKRRVTVRVKGRRKTVTRKVRSTVAAPLVMPTVFTAQNGAVLQQNTEISVVGCSKAKKSKAKSKSKRSGRRK